MKHQASFVSKMNIAFLLKNRYFPRKFAKSAAKGSQTSNQRCSSVEIRHFVVCDIYDIHMYIFDIYIYIYMIYGIYIYVYIYIYIYIQIYQWMS